MTTSASALFTDLYELSMAQVYYEQGQTDEAVFELTLRENPDGWRYLLVAGLERALDFLESLAFSSQDLAFLKSLPQFNSDFLERLAEFGFSGDVWAVPEGTVVYPPEPVLQVVAPLPEAQIVETALMNQIAFATLVATTAAHMVDAAAGRPLYEFGGRRAHGVDAALEAARATYIAGFEATSSVEAGRRFGLPVVGTMAHSYVLAQTNELDAFRRFARRYEGTTLLVDTFDTAVGVDRVVAVARELGDQAVGAIRIDSGDLASAAEDARRRLDEAGLTDVRIVVSGGLNERRIAQLVADGAPIDAFACGTAVVTGGAVGALDAAYKLVEYQDRPLAKHSPGRPSMGARKQVWRTEAADVIARYDAPPPARARPLLELVMQAGQRLPAAEPLDSIRARAEAERSAAQHHRSVRIDRSLERSRAQHRTE